MNNHENKEIKYHSFDPKPMKKMKIELDSKNLVVPTDFLTIQDAVNAAKPGDTIEVLEGVYFENVRITTDRITIQSREDETVVLNGTGLSGTGFEIEQAEGVRIRGFFIINYSTGIFVGGKNHFITDIVATENSTFGIVIRGQNQTVEDSEFFANGTAGINVSDRNHMIRNCSFGREFIGIANVSSGAICNNIFNCTIIGSSIGFLWGALESNDNVIFKNLLFENEYGIVMHSSNNTIRNNIIQGQKQDGIDILSDQITVEQNIISGNQIGITIVGENNSIIKNTIIGNTLKNIVDNGKDNKIDNTSSC
ncbi:NosD domain-containing protein [Wukongibacter baidiensis]|uniref:right-handed parallel beta-helix repeat-containing protein n=1 Tax=Wukongibacter baidiensis TaxID=1723361 RepID=UPI003D7F9A00